MLRRPPRRCRRGAFEAVSYASPVARTDLIVALIEGRNDVILGVFAAVLVAFALIVSLVVPRRWPDFPGRHMKLFVLLAVLLVAGMLAAVEALGEGHDFSAHGEAAETTASEAEGTTSEPATTGETTETEPSAPAGDPAAGKEIFASAGLRHLPHAPGRRDERDRRPEPRRGAERQGRRLHPRVDRAARCGGCRRLPAWAHAADLRRPARRQATRRPGRLSGRSRNAEAERAGFEPATQLSPSTRFPVALLRPARTPLRAAHMVAHAPGRPAGFARAPAGRA